MSKEIEQKEKLLELVRDAVAHDKNLREEFLIGDRFRFIRDRLEALLARVEENLTALRKQEEERKDEISENEMMVYVYLYNAQGLVFQSWQKMLNPSVFYEHSVNRPIYSDKSHIEAYIRSRPSKAQHGYITVVVNKADAPLTETAKDVIGNPLIKVKEGSLNLTRLISFTHNGNDYVLDEDGTLITKK